MLMSSISPRAPYIAPPLPARRSGAVERGRILLINPYYAKDEVGSLGKHFLTPTLALTSLAGATPPPWKVTMWDESFCRGPAPVDPIPEVVGITVHLTFATRAYALAARYRAMGSVVVLGGLHVSSMPDHAQPHADAIVTGIGVHVWPVLLRDLRHGTLAPRYDGDARIPYAWDPPPDRSILPEEGFLTTSSVIATRGCANRCGFCYLATKGIRTPYAVRPVDQVVDEIRRLGEPYVVFTDNNLTADREYAARLAEAMMDLGIVWTAAVTVDIAEDEALLGLLARSGCRGVFVGLESMEGANLVDAGKRTRPPSDYGRLVERFHAHRIMVNGSFVFGFDHDGPTVFRETIDWIEEARLESATFHILTPYPGTPLHRRLARQGRILTTDWTLYDTSHVVYQPARMTPRQLLEGYRWCYERLFGHASIWRRRPRGLVGGLGYLATTYLYKRSNFLWAVALRHGLVRTMWRPLVWGAWLAHRLSRAAAGQPVEAVGGASSVVSPKEGATSAAGAGLPI